MTKSPPVPASMELLNRFESLWQFAHVEGVGAPAGTWLGTRHRHAEKIAVENIKTGPHSAKPTHQYYSFHLIDATSSTNPLFL